MKKWLKSIRESWRDYMDSKKFARDNKEQMFNLGGFAKARVLGFNRITGQIKVKVFDHFANMKYFDEVDKKDLTKLTSN